MGSKLFRLLFLILISKSVDPSSQQTITTTTATTTTTTTSSATNNNIKANSRLKSNYNNIIESNSDLQLEPKTDNSIKPIESQSANETKPINQTVVEQSAPVVEVVEAVEELPSVPTPSPPNEMLSFEEWRKKIAEKSIEKTVTKSVGQEPSAPSVPVVQSPVVPKQKPIVKRHRNFASFECGAKVVDTNPESESVQRILNEQTDEYMLNPCKAKIWFVVELCETIQPKNIEIANFELYSSVPKEFNIQASDHYPTRDWSSLGTFNSLDERSVQRFQLQNNGFVKFIKIELLSHYGAEHFCPLSVVRIFGTSLFEEVERIDNMDTNQNIGVDDDESPLNEELVGEEVGAQNLFGTARDAVFNIVRKAAQALNGNNIENSENNLNKSLNSSTLNGLIDFELMAIRLYPKVNKYLQNCSKTSNHCNSCSYLKVMFGEPLYQLLIEQYFSSNVINSSLETNLLYQCNSQQKNNSNQSTKVESTINSENFEYISPTKPILSVISDPKSVENISLDNLIEISELHISVTPVVLTEVVTTSTDGLVLQTISSESLSVSFESEKSDDLLTTEANNYNKQLNDSNGSNVSVGVGVGSNDSNGNNGQSREVIRNATINDINSQNSVGTGGTGGTVGQNQNGNNGYISGSTIGQSKESVVIRLSNRIKALEVNLSLSSQYLEELSLRYRKQMEEMQRAFNITISKLNDTNSRATDRDLKQQESIAVLETKLNLLSTEMSVLLRERESLNWHYIEVHIALMMIEVIVVIVFLFICVHRLSQRIHCIQTLQKVNDRAVPTAQIALSPYKRSHPNSNPCHLPPKALKTEGDNNLLETTLTDNKSVNTQRRIRKKKKKSNAIAMNGIQLSNSLESKTFVEYENQLKSTASDVKPSEISKSQSTPALTTSSSVKSQTNGTTGLTGCRTGVNCSAHSSTSGVSSNSTLSNAFSTAKPNQLLINNEIKNKTNCNNSNKKSLNDRMSGNRGKKENEKSNSLTISLKKLLKFERK